MKLLAIAFVLVVPVTVAFYAGMLSTAFEANHCYSQVLGKLSEQAQAAAASRDGALMERYARLMQALPVRGYESQCEEIQAALEAGLATPPAKDEASAAR